MARSSVVFTSPSASASRAVLATTAAMAVAAALVLLSGIVPVEDGPGPPLESSDPHGSHPLYPMPPRWKPAHQRSRSKSKAATDICAVPSSSFRPSISRSETLYPSNYTIPVVVKCNVGDDVLRGEAMIRAFAASFGCVYNALACDKRNWKYYSQIKLGSVDVNLDVHGGRCEATTIPHDSPRRRTGDAHVSSLVASGLCESGEPVCKSEGAPLDDGALSRVSLRGLEEYWHKERCKNLPARSDFQTKVLSRVRQTTGIGIYHPEYEDDVCKLESPGAPDPASEKTYKNKPAETTVELDCDINVNEFGTQLGCALERAYNEKACNDKRSEFYSQILVTNTKVVEVDDSDCKKKDLLLEVSSQGERKLRRVRKTVVLDAEAEVASGSCDNTGDICDDEGAPLYDDSVGQRRTDLQLSMERCTKLPNKEGVEQEAINELNTVTDIDARVITNDCDSIDGTYTYEFNFALRLDCSDKKDTKLHTLDKLFACALVKAYNAVACSEPDADNFSQLVGGAVTRFYIPDKACDGSFTIQGKVIGFNGLVSVYCQKDAICNAKNVTRDERGVFLFGEGGRPCNSLPSINAVKENIILALKDQIELKILEFDDTP